MPTIGTLYSSVIRDSEFAKKNEIALREIICHIQGFHEMSEFYIKNDQEIRDLPLFLSYLARFLNGEPVAYILNYSRFLGLDLYVDNRVLIPRMETEEVVKHAILKIKEVFVNKNINIVDIGTGSGAIALALKQTFPEATLYASDISKESLEVAKINSQRNNLDVIFLQGKSLEPFIFSGLRIDVIVSNPPYITNIKEIDKSVIDYEPYKALVDEKELGVYKDIFKTYSAICNYPILMVMEIGYDMHEKIQSLVNETLPNAKFEIIKDINGKERIISILIEKA
ncbi:MAG: peptide chain release factor N(5)-glutamine methyltransferase [Bacilli bacterium]|nr:peptide chain release factor N(5)-glutamine methyltransferase [Bacilli bacterium]